MFVDLLHRSERPSHYCTVGLCGTDRPDYRSSSATSDDPAKSFLETSVFMPFYWVFSSIRVEYARYAHGCTTYHSMIPPRIATEDPRD